MKHILLTLFLAVNLGCFAQTQTEMNKQAYAEFNASDQQLNQIYKAILTEYSTDTIFIKNLKKSQRIWIQFRDSEMELKYPNYPEMRYGSSHPTCKALYLKKLTDKRIGTLKVWLDGIKEGDVCKGSVKMIQEIDSKYLKKVHRKR